MVPKVKIETVICAVPMESLIDVAKRVLNTGQFGDGKIFIYKLDNAVRIRTGKEGEDAVLDSGEKGYQNLLQGFLYIKEVATSFS